MYYDNTAFAITKLLFKTSDISTSHSVTVCVSAKCMYVRTPVCRLLY